MDMGLRDGRCRRKYRVHTGNTSGGYSPTFTHSAFDVQMQGLDDEALAHAFKC